MTKSPHRWRAPAWLWQRENPPLERIRLAPLLGLSYLYGAGARIHRALRSSRVLAVRRFDGCVVSVGSPVVGGAAKTPTAAWIASGLARRGHAVAIATRGYRGAAGRGPHVVSDGAGSVEADPARFGDEAIVLSALAPRVPVLVGRDRAAAGALAIERFGTRVLVLDDGLAHHRLIRDVSVVTLDAHHGLGNGRVLPRGPLREPLGLLGPFDAFGVVDGTLGPADTRRLEPNLRNAFRYRAIRRPTSVRPLGGDAPQPVASLRGLEVGALSGLARPDGFVRTLEALGARVVARRDFADHHPYRPADLADLAADASVWLTTEKDAVKLDTRWCPGVDVRVLRIELEVEAGDALLDWLEERIARVAAARGGSRDPR